MVQTKIVKPIDSKVSIYNNNGSILLRFTYKSKRYNISLGLPVNEKNLKIARLKCLQITNDIIFNNFDETKYGVNKREEKKDRGGFLLTSILDFYENYQQHLDSSTLESLTILRNWIAKSPVEYNNPNNLNNFLIYLKTKIPHNNSNKTGYTDKYIEVHFKILKSAINLNLKLNKISSNYNIDKIFNSLKTDKKKQIKTYTKDEIKIIINEAYCLFSYFIYGAFIEFRFLTGARPSEVVPLTWKDLIEIENKTYIIFNKRYTDGILKQGLKQKDEYRLFPVNEQLNNLLTKITKINELIFNSPKQRYIDTNNFSRRIWKPLIENLVEENKIRFYIPFYDERHCFGSHVCRQTTDLKTVSYLMGNSPETLQKYYLSVDTTFEVPEI